jgi:hypothetical protein
MNTEIAERKMSKKTVPAPERFYVGGYYITKQSDHIYDVPQGIVDQFSQWNEAHIGLQKTLEGLASYVAEQRGRLYREQNKFWNTFTDALGLPRGSQATLHHPDRTIHIEPYSEKVATLKIQIVDKD